MFEHEKLQVYQLSRDLNREICRITKLTRKGSYDHVDQLVRAGASIARNLAEGSGEWAVKEKAKFYRYAKRSAAEATASLDVLIDYEMAREEDTGAAKELLSRITPMLVKLIQLFESGAASRQKPNRPIPRTSPTPGIPGPGPQPANRASSLPGAR